MNMQAMLKQAQALQKDMMKIKNEIDETEFVGESSMVKVTMKGTREAEESWGASNGLVVISQKFFPTVTIIIAANNLIIFCKLANWYFKFKSSGEDKKSGNVAGSIKA